MSKAEEEKELSWEDHLAAAIKGFRKEMKETGMGILPEEFKTHRRAAKREMLLAFRSLLDARIEKMDTTEKNKTTGKATKIQVE